jgi:hypothetical protein
MITGGVLDAKEKGTPGEMKMDPKMIKAICDEAHRLGYKTAAHVESTEGVIEALKNGVDSIEHGAAPTEEMIRLFKEKHAFLTTTLSPALPYALFPREVSNASEVEQYKVGLLLLDESPVRGFIVCRTYHFRLGNLVADDAFRAFEFEGHVLDDNQFKFFHYSVVI